MFYIAKRFIFSNKIQTISIILGIAVGIAVQFFIAILIDSLQANLINTTVGSSPHITISGSTENKDLVISNEFLYIIKDNEAIVKIQKEYQENVFVTTASEESSDNALLLKAIEIRSDSDIYKINENLIQGTLPKEQEVLIGLNFAEDENLKIGDNILLNFSDRSSINATISGIFDLGNSSLNERWLIGNLAWVQKLRGKKDILTTLNLQVRDVFEADIVAENLSNSLYIKNNSGNLSITNWKEANSQLLSGLQGQSISSLFIQVFVLISVIIGIVSVLNILVIQKSKEIGILKAIGLKDNQSGQIFVIQSAFLGSLGTIVGVLFGLGLFFAFVTFVKTESGDPIVQPVIKWQFFMLTALVNIVVSTVSGLIPAIKTSKLDPVDIINNS